MWFYANHILFKYINIYNQIFSQILNILSVTVPVEQKKNTQADTTTRKLAASALICLWCHLFPLAHLWLADWLSIYSVSWLVLLAQGGGLSEALWIMAGCPDNPCNVDFSSEDSTAASWQCSLRWMVITKWYSWEKGNTDIIQRKGHSNCGQMCDVGEHCLQIYKKIRDNLPLWCTIMTNKSSKCHRVHHKNLRNAKQKPRKGLSWHHGCWTITESVFDSFFPHILPVESKA